MQQDIYNRNITNREHSNKGYNLYNQKSAEETAHTSLDSAETEKEGTGG